MIKIYYADAAAGHLYTDPLRRAYIDADILREHATQARTRATREKLAARMGFSSWEVFATFCACRGLTADARDKIIQAGNLELFKKL